MLGRDQIYRPTATQNMLPFCFKTLLLKRKQEQQTYNVITITFVPKKTTLGKYTVLPKCYAFEKIYLVKKSSNEKSNGTLWSSTFNLTWGTISAQNSNVYVHNEFFEFSGKPGFFWKRLLKKFSNAISQHILQVGIF